MELQLDQEYKEYIKTVSDVLEAYYAHSLRNIPENFGVVLSSWTSLFIKCGIPANQLMDVYLEAHINLEKGEYFNVDTVIAAWNGRKEQRLQEARLREVCTICNDTLLTKKYDFRLREDITIDCPKCV